jgi:hypothetical protein
MRDTLTQRLHHDEEVLKNTSQSLMQTANMMFFAMLAFLAVCAAVLLLGS